MKTLVIVIVIVIVAVIAAILLPVVLPRLRAKSAEKKRLKTEKDQNEARQKLISFAGERRSGRAGAGGGPGAVGSVRARAR